MEDQSITSHKDTNLVEFNKNVNDYLSYHVKFADTKAGIFLAGCFAIVSTLTKSQFSLHLPGILVIIATICFAISAIFGFLVIIPRLPTGQNGLIFWEDIRAWNSKEKYLTEIKDLDKKEIELQCKTELDSE
jgi:hypothetical protein